MYLQYIKRNIIVQNDFRYQLPLTKVVCIGKSEEGYKCVFHIAQLITLNKKITI